MGLISITTPNDGENADAADLTNPLNTIVSEINGNLDANNLAASAVTTAKINNEAVTTAKIADNAVTPAKRSGGFYIANFSPTSTGTTAITGAGFAPNVAIFMLRTADSSTVGGSGMGFATSDGLMATTANYSEQGADDSSDSATNLAFMALSTNSDTVVAGTVSAWGSDGITINTTVRSAARSFSVLLLR